MTRGFFQQNSRRPAKLTAKQAAAEETKPAAPPPPADPDDLTLLTGIGQATAGKLRAADIDSFGKIANAGFADLKAVLPTLTDERYQMLTAEAAAYA